MMMALIGRDVIRVLLPGGGSGLERGGVRRLSGHTIHRVLERGAREAEKGVKVREGVRERGV